MPIVWRLSHNSALAAVVTKTDEKIIQQSEMALRIMTSEYKIRYMRTTYYETVLNSIIYGISC